MRRTANAFIGYIFNALAKCVSNRLVKYISDAGIKCILLFLVITVFLPAAIPQANAAAAQKGCCLLLCTQTTASDCPGQYVADTKCKDVPKCNLGCCIDDTGISLYCFDNYLQGKCSFKFYKKNCAEIPVCKMEKTQGRPKEVGPKSGVIGTQYRINYVVTDPSEVGAIRASIIQYIKETSKDIKTMQLYDDGSHGDRNKNDGVYGNIWDSSRISRFNGIQKYSVDVTIKSTNGNTVTIHQISNFTVIENTACLPIGEWKEPETAHDIIFIGNNYSAKTAEFNAEVNKNINAILQTEPFRSSASQINFYTITGEFSFRNPAQALEKVSRECRFYDGTQDIAIMLDASQEICDSRTVGIISTSPDSSHATNQQYPDVKKAVLNMCAFITTEKQHQRDAAEKKIAPEIIIYNSNDTVYTTPNPILQFSAIDNKDTSINYSVHYNNSVVETGAIANGTTKNIALTRLETGMHYYGILAEDNDHNYAMAAVQINVSIPSSAVQQSQSSINSSTTSP